MARVLRFSQPQFGAGRVPSCLALPVTHRNRRPFSISEEAIFFSRSNRVPSKIRHFGDKPAPRWLPAVGWPSLAFGGAARSGRSCERRAATSDRDRARTLSQKLSGGRGPSFVLIELEVLPMKKAGFAAASTSNSVRTKVGPCRAPLSCSGRAREHN